MDFAKIIKTKRQPLVPLQITHGELQVQIRTLVSVSGRTVQTAEEPDAGLLSVRAPWGASGWAGAGALRTCQVPSQSPFFANLLSDTSPFHLLVIAQTVLSEEI